MKVTEKFRIEKDSLGTRQIPQNAYWGIQTQRAMDNFPISGLTLQSEFIRALGLIKLAAAEINFKLDLISEKIGKVIIKSSKEVMEGKWNSQFKVDVFQTGSGTSTNMNANEVIANRANEILGVQKGTKEPVHPNDHVNMGQSSNDVIPTCIHIAGVVSIKTSLIPALAKLHRELESKAKEFDTIVKLGRTHLQDATPVRLGQEFGGYAAMIKKNMERLKHNLSLLQDLALGGTAVGTGINRHPDFPTRVIRVINRITNQTFQEARNHFEAQGAKDAIVQMSATLKTLAVSLTKIANDIRWMGSGPHGGIGELLVPVVQPGSSIMPGKVNPVIPEAVLQIAAQVIGNDTVITQCGQSGNFELNVMMPVMAYNLLQSIEILTNGINIFRAKCITGLKANRKRCKDLVEKSPALITVLNPVIGYDNAAEIVKEAEKSGKSLRDIIKAKKILSPKELKEVLDLIKMTEPRKVPGNKTT